MVEADTLQGEWWKSAVFYEIYVRSFRDSNGDGIGDLRGIIDKLDYLNDGTPSSLGIDAIWLSPVHPSPDYDFGYDVSDFSSINPAFGTMEDFDELLREAHDRGIRVVMDLVMNHTSDEHPWFMESRSSRDNPYRDWYIWRDGRSFRRPPNRWRSAVLGSAWTYDRDTRQYYYHAFLKRQPDLNWRNPSVKASMFDVARFWLDRGVDGFRLDLINHLVEDEELRDNPRCLGRYPYEWQEHIYDRDRPETHQVLKEFRGLLDEYGDRMMVSEVYAFDPKLAASFYGEGDDESHLVFNYDYLFTRFAAKSFRRVVTEWDNAVPEEGWPALFLGSHDTPRLFSRYGRFRDAWSRAKVLAALLLTSRGTPFMYYGDEIGMSNCHIPRWEMQDPVGRLVWPIPMGRDRCRTPMQWNGGPFAGFTSGTPWLRVHRSYKHRNVEEQSANEESLLDFYRRLIHLRRRTPALNRGSMRVWGGTQKIWQGVPLKYLTYLREHGDQSILVAMNFHGRMARLHGPSEDGHFSRFNAFRTIFSTHQGQDEFSDLRQVVLAPYQVLIMEAVGST